MSVTKEAWAPVKTLMGDLEQQGFLPAGATRRTWVLANFAAEAIDRIIDEREGLITELERRSDRRRRIGRFLRRLAITIEES